MRRRSGFTLIELLVVIAIIAILAAILFPVFANAKKTAQLASCTSNMKQFGNAFTLYRDDNNGNLPIAWNIWSFYSWSTTTQGNYYEAAFPYMKNTGVAICPSQPITGVKSSLANLWYTDTQHVKKSKWYGAVYTMTMHSHAKGDTFGVKWGNALPHITWSRPGSPVNPDTINYGQKYNSGRAAEAIMLFCMSGTWTISWDDPNIRQVFPDKIAHGSHETGTPCLFADTHVKFVDYTRVGNL